MHFCLCAFTCLPLSIPTTIVKTEGTWHWCHTCCIAPITPYTRLASFTPFQSWEMTAQELKAAHLMPVQQLAHCSLDPCAGSRECSSWCCQHCGYSSVQEQHPSPTACAPQSFQHAQQQRKSWQFYMVYSGLCSCWQTVRRKGTFDKDRPQSNRHRDTAHWQALKRKQTKPFALRSQNTSHHFI